MMIILFLSLAAFFAGFMDSIAGGGGLITLPALLAVGVPPHLALGTNKFQSMFGTTFGLANFARKAHVVWKLAAVGVPFAIVGSAIGSKLALVISSTILAKIIVGIIPPIAIFLLFSGSLVKRKKSACHPGLGPGSPKHNTRKIPAFAGMTTAALVCFIVGAYDGFLGPGTGTFFIIALVLFSKIPFLSASATAKTFNLASNTGSLIVFLIAGQVYFFYGLMMAAANIAGNLVGSHFAMKHGDTFVKKILIVSLTILFGYLIWKYF